MACYANQFQAGIDHLLGVWENLHVSKVYRTDVWTAIRDGWRWFMAFSGSLGQGYPHALLDNKPLQELLESHLRLARIQQAIDNGALRAVSITASGYSSGRSICYFQGIAELEPWQRTRRQGCKTELSLDHIMASIALPTIFPPVCIRGEYHGDGSMRETAPLSPALHLGAERLLVVAVRNPTPNPMPIADSSPPYPSFGQIAGCVLDTLFMDTHDAFSAASTRRHNARGTTAGDVSAV